MKKFLLFVVALFVCGVAVAHTINWHDGNTTTQTTCSAGDNITPPTPIGKYGYHFKEWEPEYIMIEYLESTGTQYIDTGIKQSDYVNNLIFEIDFQYTSVDGVQILAGTTLGESRYYLITLSNNKFTSITAYGTQSITLANADTYRHSFISNTQTATAIFDNVQYNYINANSAAALNIFLFANNDEGRVRRFATGKIYNVSFKTADNILVRDFIPVLDKNGTPCLYDKVEGEFYYNQGTGQFVAGPVLQ